MIIQWNQKLPEPEPYRPGSMRGDLLLWDRDGRVGTFRASGGDNRWHQKCNERRREKRRKKLARIQRRSMKR